MFRVILAILFILVDYEFFYLLPEHIRIPIKGTFRLRDIILLVSPVLMLITIKSIKNTFKDNRQASMLVVLALAAFFVNPFIAQLFFNQPFMTGLLGFRHNISSYLLFYVFSGLLVTEQHIKTFCWVMVILTAAYLVILMVNRSYPNLGLIYTDKSWYERADRFGGRRMFFPYGLLYLMFYFITLADFLYGSVKKSKIRLVGGMLFIALVLRALLLTGTRQFIFIVPFVSCLALVKSKRKYYVIILLVVFIGYKQVSTMVTSGGGSWFSNSRIGMLFTDTPGIAKETGRQLQTRMSIDNFLRSPLFGVGSLIDSKDMMKEYAVRGFFNAPDIGIIKIAAEYGLLGIVWVVCIYVLVFKRTGTIIRSVQTGTSDPFRVTLARGIRYFYIFLLLNSMTLPPFINLEAMPVIALSLVFLRIPSSETTKVAAYGT